ncbi:glycosyltransferase family 39 protein [Nocardia cyriacigeorgica]|uniref:Glycosyltransferase family 39 protein n=1 Tax=Nocardia cyriacigeorgica TaxID=135487 RepID=A0A6P1D5B6_9NOCA|nr:glycosyltransferase family 39 protein [Nocardia cyriacigeorgica]NEW43372.1 glycosyltransferase family 39 protein [Nocardia cyriacigeorgica]
MTITATASKPAPAAPTESAPIRTRRWEYPALAVLLLGTGLAYHYNLSANGWANSFYSAAVQAGSVSWKAFFFGSSDAANSITVDKPPASLWLMELSVRLFGVNSWSMLVPQVLLGVATVALVWATVRRSFGAPAGLITGLALAVTPVAALMFRFNNPDALLVFLMVAAAWAMLRAVEDGRWRWLVLTGAFIGFGFLAKQLQVLLVVPALALTYLIAGPPRLGKRIVQLFAAGAVMVVAAGWWLLAVELWPESERPWIGGSHNNSILELTLGYNGLGRLNGNETGSVGPGGELPPGGNGMWGSTGIGRMFDAAQGGQIAWLIPAALVALVAGLLLRGRAARTDLERAALILWGGWLLVTGLVFSFMAGIFHQYYTVALAPAIAALVGIGAQMAWRNRSRWWVRVCTALAVGLTTATAWMLLSRSVDFVPWLGWVVLVAGVLATIAVVIPMPTKPAVGAAVLAGIVALSGPVAYTVDTLNSAHTGPIPTAGPETGGMGGPGGMRFGDGGRPGMPPGTDGGAVTPGSAGTSDGGPDGASTGKLPTTGAPTGQPSGRDGFGGMGGGPGGGVMGASEPGDELVALLEQDGATYTWVAATVGSNSAAGYQLATELPVMPIGGFNGSDPSPTLEQFQQYVEEGKIHYFLGGNRGGPSSGDAESARIAAWVQENFTATEVDGVAVYDLTR